MKVVPSSSVLSTDNIGEQPMASNRHTFAVEASAVPLPSHRLHNSVTSITQPLLGMLWWPLRMQTPPSCAIARGSMLIAEESSHMERLPPGAHAAAAQRSYMHAIRRLHAIRDLEHKHLAVTSSWKTEAMQWLQEATNQVLQVCTLWRGAIHSVEARHGALVCYTLYIRCTSTSTMIHCLSQPQARRLRSLST